MNNKSSTPSVVFNIPGQPKSKENKGAFGRGSFYSKTHKEIKLWEEEVGKIAKAAMEEAGWTGPWKGRVGIMADMTFADYGRKDITNYWKSLNDALNDVVYLDDSQIDFAATCRNKDKNAPGIYVEVYFFDYMYAPVSAKRPDPYKIFSIAKVKFDFDLKVHSKEHRLNKKYVGKFLTEEEVAEKETKRKQVNDAKRKTKNGNRAKASRKRRANRKISKPS